MNVIDVIFARKPSTATPEQHNMIGAALGVTVELQRGLDVIAKRDDLTAKGRVGLVQVEIRKSGAAFRKSLEQFEKHGGTIENMRLAMRVKAIGEPRDTDAEYRSFLRSLPLSERIAKVNNNPLARGAALREPGLSGLSTDVLDAVMETAVAENAAEEAAKVAEYEAAHEVMKAAIDVARGTIMRTEFMTDVKGNPRRPSSEGEMTTFLAAAA